jgi:hypothetical protein
MGQRVLLLVVGLVIALVLVEVVGVPRRWALLIGMLPFALKEASGLGPYEKSARDLMFDDGDKKG